MVLLKRYTQVVVDSTDSLNVQTAVLETKFYFPRWRPGQVPRSRLVERMGRGTQSRLTVVSAPPGFGKTTLLAEWLAASASASSDMAWVSLDPSDNHSPRFWAYVFRALQRARPAVGECGAIAMLESPQPPPIESLLVMILNEVAADSTDLVLVLDDYHVIDSGPIHEAVSFLLDHMPPQMHLVIVSRSDPPLPLSRMRARGELTEVRAADLRFTSQEAASFLNDAMGLHLAARDVAVLESRTEGWIAALQLAAISMQGREDVAGFISSFAGDDRYIVDYLVEEVLEQQPPQMREFLLHTSILEALHAPLCDAVTGLDSAKATLESLERCNLFLVPLDDKRQWYRYHHLFADVLRAHLVEEEPEEVAALHRRASEWYSAQGDPARAIRHALAGTDLERAAGLIELEAQAVVREHQPDRLIEWAKPIPDDLIRRMPVLSTYLSLALQGMGDLEGSASRLNEAERWLTDSTGSAGRIVVDEAAFGSLPSRVALARGYIASATGDAETTVEEARRALEFLEPDEHHWHGTASALLSLAHWASGRLDAAHPIHAEGLASFERAGDFGLFTMSSFHGADLLRARGRLSEAGRLYERSLGVATGHGPAAMRFAANLHLGLSELCCERNDLAGAAHHLQVAEEMGIYPPRTPYRYCLARARLRQSHGDFAGALGLLEEAEKLRVPGAVPDVRPIAPWKVRLWLQQGKVAQALEWTREQGLSVDDDLSYAREFEHIVLARVLLASATAGGDVQSLERVEQLLLRLRSAAEAGGRVGAAIEVLNLQAIAAQSAKGGTAGLAHLEQALTVAEPEGYVRTFIDEGEPMRELLRHAVAAGVGGAYARRLLAAFETPAALAVPPGSAQGLAEPLTARELEILRLVAAGMRNQEIADYLVISLPTVKRHIANTYGKLGVENRTGALARAAELGLLEPR